MEDNRVNQPGSVWIKDGKIYVRNPRGDAPPAVVTPGPGIRLYVNGVEQHGATPVREEDKIVIEPELREEPGRVTVMVAPNKFKAFVDIRLTKQFRYNILDAGPQQSVVVKTSTVSGGVMPIDKEALRHLLAENGVTHGIIEETLDLLYKRPSNGRFLIAEGVTPEPSTDDRVELHFNLTEEGRPLISANGTVDYRNLGRFSSVEAGALLATKHPGVPGKPGYRVNGEEVYPLPPKAIELEAGHGASLSADGKAVTAAISGRPVLRRSGSRYIFSVDPQLIITGDVDLTTGNVNFRGCVKITGNVHEAMKVEATGDVSIGGEVAEAVIDAQGSVSARSIISSSVRAGGQGVYYEKLKGPVAELAQLLVQAVKSVGPLMDYAATRNQKLTPATALLLLIDQRFQRIPHIIRDLSQIVESAPQFKIKLPPEFRDTVRRLKEMFLKLGIATCGNLEPVKEALDNLSAMQSEILQLISSAHAKVVADYVLNSNIEATGDIYITGQGAFNSNLISGGQVKIDGIFRGGEINAQDNVFIGKAGSDIGVQTTVKVARGKKITIKKAYPGVLLYIGKQVAEITKPQREIRASIDDEGRIDLNAISWNPSQDKTS
ncbi:MAG: FapA family protein [Bacillota bacterium]